MKKLYFCSSCGVLLNVQREPDEGDECGNCNTDLFSNDPITGQFEDDDAKQLLSKFNQE